MMWMVWMFIDFPVSLLAIPFELFVSDFFTLEVFYTYVLGAFFLIMGGGQWYCLTKVLQYQRKNRTGVDLEGN